MKKSDYLVKASNEGEIHVHIMNIGPTDHLTMCGLDGNDPLLEQAVLPLKRTDKMDCPLCKIYYNNRKKLNINPKWLEDDIYG